MADAHRCDGQRSVVRADEKLTAFMELDSAIRGCGFRGLTTERDFPRLGVAEPDSNQEEDICPARFFAPSEPANH